jgi:hypothetical protein
MIMTPPQPPLALSVLFRSFRPLAVGLVILGACGGAPSRSAPPAAMRAQPSAPAAEMTSAEAGFSDVNTDRSLNTTSHVRAWAEDLLATASRFRKHVYKLEGYVVNERIDYEDTLRAPKPKLPTRASRRERGKAVFTVSLPIEQVPPMLDWVRANSRVVEQYVYAVRDSSIPTPAAAAAQHHAQRKQLEQRLAAVEKQLEQADEANRPRLEAERDALLAQLAQLSQQIATSGVPEVKYSTLNVYFEADQPQVRFAAARVAPSVRATLLVGDLLNEGDGRDVLVGGAVGFALPSKGPGGLLPSPLVELAGYPAKGDRDAAVVATIGIGKYARSMGDGRNVWLNPFAGLRMGYAYLGNSALVVAGELGIELYKSSGVALSASLRPQGLIGKDSQVALEAGSSLTFAF